MRIGVAGLGFGLNLLKTLLVRDDCAVAAVADHFPERRAFAEARGLPAYADAATMIRKAGLDAVVLASAPHVRGAGLDAALEAGLPAFVEKPLAATPEQARELVARCEGRPVMMGFSFRFHRPVQRLLAEVGGALGPGQVLNAEYLFDWLPPAENWLWDPEKGGGFFNENSCHLLDVVTALMGRPEAVSAFGFDDGARPSATAAALTLSFPGGGVAALTLGGRGTAAFGDFPKLDIACANGQARMRGRQHMWTGLAWAERGGEVRTLAYEPEALGRTRYSDALDHFLAAIRDDRPFDATPEDGALAVDVADAIHRSIGSGSTVTLKGDGA